MYDVSGNFSVIVINENLEKWVWRGKSYDTRVLKDDRFWLLEVKLSREHSKTEFH